MEKSQSSEMPSESPNPDKDKQPQSVKPKPSDVDLANVRGLMFALISVCMFCVSILFGPDKAILPADGDLTIPFIGAKVSRGSFLYVGPAVIIFISIYIYLFIFRILLNLREGNGFSDKYIFTMNSPVARCATYGIFFWLPALVLFAFFYKALPRPESTTLLGIALTFLALIISLQLSLHIQPKYFLVMNLGTIFFVAVILFGFGGIGTTGEGWLASARSGLLTFRPLILGKANLESRDLKGVNITKADAEFIILKDADLRYATLNEVNLTEANLEKADLRHTKLNCANLFGAKLQEANLSNAELRGTYLKGADLRSAELIRADFYRSSQEDWCNKESTGLLYANLGEVHLEGANLSSANLSRASLISAWLSPRPDETIETVPTILNKAKLIGAELDTAILSEAKLYKADLRCSYLTDVEFSGAVLIEAKLAGAVLTQAMLNNADLDSADFSSFKCNEGCMEACIACTEERIISPEENKKEKKNMPIACEQCYECGKDEHGESADLTDAQLKNSSLLNADLRGVTLTDADLEGADLKEADLRGAVGLTCNQLVLAKNWEAAFRNEPLACGSEIPPYPEGEDEHG